MELFLDKRIIIKIRQIDFDRINNCIEKNKYRWKIQSDFVRSAIQKLLREEGF